MASRAVVGLDLPPPAVIVLRCVVCLVAWGDGVEKLAHHFKICLKMQAGQSWQRKRNRRRKID